MSYTFHNNRSVFLDTVLQQRGWTRAQPDQKADFGMWATHDEADRDSTIKLYDRERTDLMDNKRKFYLHLLDQSKNGATGTSDLLDNIPESYLSWEEVLSVTQKPNDTRLWFLKHQSGTEGKLVWCYHNLQELEVYALKPGIMPTYIIQREVPNMKLIVGYKVTLRVYALIWQRKVYIYQQYTGKFHPERYNRESLGRNVHVESAATGVVFPFLANDWEHHEKIYPKIVDVTGTVINSFLPYLTENDRAEEHKNRYSLLGLDYIIDADYKPWLIEINTYPFLWDKNGLVTNIKMQLLNDLFDLVIGPTISDSPGKLGRFSEL